MKKLLVVASLAVACGSVFADGDILDEMAADTEQPLEVETEAEPIREAIWPAFFAFAEWPETPDLIGVRLTIPFSTKQESVTGIDIGLWGRCRDFEGVQLNLLRNDVKDTLGGAQVGFYNSVNRGDLFGIQLGLFNEANSFRGVQAGIINVTGDGEGFQVGIFNRAETFYGFQIGLINVIRDAEIPVFPIVNIGF